ncbi:MAG TPA: hypothetical protein VN752_05160 [Solirubrobacterales bacterium]|nr:hypothetical protein [Solirubrobacterales bacterium]
MPFAASIAVLSLVQAALVALPVSRPLPTWLERGRSPWWALIPALSIVVVIVAIELSSDSATALTYLALVAVPPLAALALAWLLRGSRLVWALAALPLFALAWALPDALAGEASATALSGLACIALGWLLVNAVPARWLRLGIYAMAVLDACLVAANLLQGPSDVLSSAAPLADLPALQVANFGAARMGFGDLFVAALVGCLLASDRRRQIKGALLAAALALAFDLLFFAVDTLPATVPVAVSLALIERRRTTR